MKIIKKESDHKTKVVLKAVPPHELRPQTFKKGRPGGPGRPKETIAVKEIKKYTRTTLAEMLNRLMITPMAQVREILADESTPVIERSICKALVIGDWDDIDKILDRVVGKVTQKIEVDGDGMENHNHLHLGETATIPELGDRIKALATRLSTNSSR